RARLSAGSSAGYGSRPDDAPPSDGALPRAGRRLRRGEDPERRPEPDGTVDQRSHRVLLSDAELRLRPDARRSAAVVESPPARGRSAARLAHRRLPLPSLRDVPVPAGGDGDQPRHRPAPRDRRRDDAPALPGPRAASRARAGGRDRVRLPGWHGDQAALSELPRLRRLDPRRLPARAPRPRAPEPRSLRAAGGPVRGEPARRSRAAVRLLHRLDARAPD